jgi:hypothetical protein
MCEGNIGQYPHVYFDKPFICRTNENALIKQIYECGKTQATRKDWSAEFINPISLN